MINKSLDNKSVMKVSIAMATYNGAKYLKEQLSSLATQTYLPNELVVCDDGSTDETLSILGEFKKNAPFRVRIYKNSERLGFIGNFERIIGLCQGELIFFSDQDDIWMSEKIQKMLNVFNESSNVGYIFSDAVLIDEMRIPIGSLWKARGFKKSRIKKYVYENQVEVFLKGSNFVYGNTLAFRSKYRDIVLPIYRGSRAVSHDIWISLLLSASGVRGAAIPEKLILYRQHDQQATDANKRKRRMDGVLAIIGDKRGIWLDKVNFLRAISERVKSVSGNSTDLLDQCVRHLEARASLHSQSKWAKICLIFTELVSGRYSRYSSSLISAFRDFLFS